MIWDTNIVASAIESFGPSMLCQSCKFDFAGIHGVVLSVSAEGEAGCWCELCQLSQALWAAFCRCDTIMLWGHPFGRGVQGFLQECGTLSCVGKTYLGLGWGWRLPRCVNVTGVLRVLWGLLLIAATGTGLILPLWAQWKKERVTFVVLGISSELAKHLAIQSCGASRTQLIGDICLY